MADIELVIKIPQETYGFLKRYGTDGGIIEKAVLNGKLLPKGHKRLIDADKLLKRISEKAKIPSLSEDTVNGLCGATAIIYDMLNKSEESRNDKNRSVVWKSV